MEELFVKKGAFIGENSGYKNASVVLMGAPMDFTASFRAGSREGPFKIRQVSDVLEEYSPMRDRELGEVSFADLGDLILPFGNTEKSLKIIQETVRKCLRDGKVPFVLGGEHLVSLPAVKELHECYSSLKVVQFDAHADLREEYLGEKLSHASVMRHICKLVSPKNVYQLGIRSGTREEYAYGRKHTNFFPWFDLADVKKAAEECAGFPVYLTIDIDVLDPAFAPGTGTPEPGGCTSAELLTAVGLLKDIKLVGCDIVEVAPPYDSGDITSITAAKLIREILVTFF